MSWSRSLPGRYSGDGSGADGCAATWAKLTPENLAVVQVKNEAGLTAGNYTDLVLDDETSKVAADGTVLTSYRLRPQDGPGEAGGARGSC